MPFVYLASIVDENGREVISFSFFSRFEKEAVHEQIAEIVAANSPRFGVQVDEVEELSKEMVQFHADQLGMADEPDDRPKQDVTFNLGLPSNYAIQPPTLFPPDNAYGR